jgi:hypothetical protein
LIFFHSFSFLFLFSFPFHLLNPSYLGLIHALNKVGCHNSSQGATHRWKGHHHRREPYPTIQLYTSKPTTIARNMDNRPRSDADSTPARANEDTRRRGKDWIRPGSSESPGYRLGCCRKGKVERESSGRRLGGVIPARERRRRGLG